MSKKSPKIQELIRECPPSKWSPYYIGFFMCFNRGDYYEAHDVLEELWLEEGKGSENYAFYKGLIQGAGAFVHLQKHHSFPDHRIHGNRLNPAARLFRLAIQNVSQYGERHQDLQISDFTGCCRAYLSDLEESDYRLNPWTPEKLPSLKLDQP